MTDFESSSVHGDTVAFDNTPVGADNAQVASPAADNTPAAPNGFALLNLAPELIAAVADLGFTQPTTVQQQSIGRALAQDAQGRSVNDLMVSSQTGSGKTAAFLLPVLDTLIRQKAAEAAAEQKAYDEAVARG